MPSNNWKQIWKIVNDFGCPFVPENEPTDDHCADLFCKPSPQREKILRWCTNEISQNSKEMKITDCVFALGLCKTIDEAKNFDVGLSLKKDQESIWDLFLKMVPKKDSLQGGIEFEAVFNGHFNNARLIDSVSERDCLQKQLCYPIEITPHGLERNKISKGKGRVAEVPNIQVFQKLSEKAYKEKNLLVDKLSSQKKGKMTPHEDAIGLISGNANKEDRDENESVSNVNTAINELSTASDLVCDKVGQFDVKFINELEHWLSGRGRTEVVSRPNIAATAERMGKYHKYFSSNETMTNSSHVISSAEISDGAASNNTFLDIDTLSLT